MSQPLSIRAFVGSLDFETSLKFYKMLGFYEIKLENTMSYLQLESNLGFGLQKYLVKG